MHTERHENSLSFYYACAAAILLMGILLRCTGFDRGTSDYIAQPSSTSNEQRAFYTFHPDESTIVQASLKPINPFNPPFTAYGLLPVYILRGTLTLVGLEDVVSQDTEGIRSVYLTARFLAICLSTACLLFTWLLGMRYFSPQTALFALFLLSVAPGAVQQAHFYIVDGVFLALALAAIYLGTRAVERGSLPNYVCAGLLIGGASACRLNGVLLGIVLVALDSSRHGWHLSRLIRSRPLWAAGTTALATLLCLHPYMLSNPLWFQQSISHHDFGLSVKIANGSILQTWTLAHYNTVPYLDTWIKLLPLSVGWPFSLLAPIAVAYTLWRGPWPARGMLIWCGLQFLLIGSLMTQHVRYTVSFLPFTALCVGHFFHALNGRSVEHLQRIAHALLIVITVLHIGFQGVAFASIYTKEDSRITAARTIAQQVPEGSRIGIERGGFTMSPLINRTQNEVFPLGTTANFYGAPYMLCSSQADLLRNTLKRADYIAIVLENRASQFGEVPSLFPVAADFYSKLINGQLGFEKIEHFKVRPSYWELSVVEENPELSFLSYDHPNVVILKKNSDVFENAIERWVKYIVASQHCPDANLRAVAASLNNSDYEQAIEQIDALIKRLPYAKLAYPIAAEIYQRQGLTDESERFYASYRPINEHGLMAHLNSANALRSAPIRVALSLIELGLSDLALHVLKRSAFEDQPFLYIDRLYLAELYSSLAISTFDRQADAQRDVLEWAVSIAPHQRAFNHLGDLAWQQGNREQAISHWENSLVCNPGQATVYWKLYKATVDVTEMQERARYYFDKVVELDPNLNNPAGDIPTLR